MKNTAQINDDGSEEYNFTASNGIQVRQVILKDRSKTVEFTKNGEILNSYSEDSHHEAMIEFINWKNS